MDTPEEQALEERANELYWSSDESVNQIADELELSKSSLYALIRPLASGLPCPRCSAEMEYANRTARDRGYLTCPECDLEEDEELVRSEWREEARKSPAGTVVVSPGSGSGPRAGRSTSRDPLGRMLAAAAFLGAAVGVVFGLWARRK